MQRRRFTLTERVVWAVTATVALLVGLQSLLAFVALHTQEDELIDTMLQREVQQIVAHILQPGLTPVGKLLDSTSVSAWLSRDGAGAGEIPAPMRALAPGLYQLAPPGRTLHVAVADTDDGRLTVALDASASEGRVHRFGLTLLALWIACVAATVWIARAVAAVAVEPIVTATRSIAGSAPGRPLDTSARSVEAAVLMETFNRFRDRVDDMVAREREFAASLDHEIRTPLTTIRTDAELLGLEAALAPLQQARLDRITAAVDEICATTASTLSFSAGRPAGSEWLDLRAFLAGVAESMAGRAASAGLHIAIDVPTGAQLHGDRQALLTVVRNLVRNAIEHAAPATLRIGGNAGALDFADDGPGIAEAARPQLFERLDQRRPEGAPAPGEPRRGLGLAIARRLCELQGWTLQALPATGPAGRPAAAGSSGTSFRLTFAAPDQAPAAP